MSVKGFSVNGAVEQYDAGSLANVSGIIDTTLTQSGKAADAKAAGDDLSNLKSALDEYEDIFTADVSESIDNWLDAHPEATTTVQDGSLTEAKFTDDLKLKAIKDYVTPQMYGAKGDGVADDTTAVQSALNSGKSVFIPKGTYKVSAPLTVPSFTKVLGAGLQETTIYNIGNSNAFELDSVRDITLEALNIKGDYTYGSASPTGNTLHGLDLKHCSFMTFRDVAFWFNGKSGVNFRNNTYACYFYNCNFSYNGEHGVDASDASNPASDTCNYYGCRFGSNAKSGIIFNGSVLSVYGGYIEANSVGVTLLSSISPASSVYFSGVDIEGNTNHGVVFSTDANVAAANLGIMQGIKFISGQISGKSGNTSLFHFDIARQTYKRVVGLEISCICSKFDGAMFTTETNDEVIIIGKIDDSIIQNDLPSNMAYYIGTQMTYKYNVSLDGKYIKSNKIYRGNALQNVIYQNDSMHIEFVNHARIESITFTIQSPGTITASDLLMYAVDYDGTVTTITPTLSYDLLTYSINRNRSRDFYIINKMSNLVYLYGAKYNGSIPV